MRRLMSLAIDGRLAQAMAEQPEEYGVPVLKAALDCDAEPAKAWAQLVLLDAYRIQRMWPNPMPYAACLRMSNVVAEAYGPPPPPLAVMKASELTRHIFIKATAKGRAAKFALNPDLPDGPDGPETQLVADIARHACQYWAQECNAGRLDAVGQLFRCLHVTSRRLHGVRISDDYAAVDWAGAADNNSLSLPLLRLMLSMCYVEPTANGFSALMIMTASPTAWVERPWSRYGCHNFATDVLALWANVARRTPVELESWARMGCAKELEYCTGKPRRGGPITSKIKFLKEYDPVLDLYFAVRAIDCTEDDNGCAWVPAAHAPAALKAEFANRRSVLRSSETGRAMAGLLTSAGEIGTELVRRVARVLHAILQTAAPGDRGLNSPDTLRRVSGHLRAPGWHMSWRALCDLPRLPLLAVHSPDPLPTDQGAIVVLRIIKQAFKSKQTARDLIELARSCYADAAGPSLESFKLRPPCAALSCPKDVLRSAAMSVVCGTDPERFRYTATMAAAAAFAVPAAEVHGILLHVLAVHNKLPAKECSFAALTGLQRHLPPELQLHLLRHWVLTAALHLALAP